MAHFVAGALTASLLTEDKKPNIIHNTYVPLSESQADLYMTTKEYEQYLHTYSKSIFFYADRDLHYQPKILENRETGKRRHITSEQGMTLVERNNLVKKPNDKTILMTKGIGGLPAFQTNEIGELESRVSLFVRSIFFCFCFYCLIKECTDEEKDLYYNGPSRKDTTIARVFSNTFRYLDKPV
ncbi:MAG: hypothetical protein K940chlam5_01242 [Candidatus Anoxychlamydiales bacterium]|nr:hypothetical protein [Candidatus Anoxychlamydiales bacterium]